MNDIQKRATVAHRTVTEVSQGKHEPPRRPRKRTKGTPKASKVEHSHVHPAFVMAHAFGYPKSHVQVIGEPPLWSCVIWNHPAPWPGQET